MSLLYIDGFAHLNVNRYVSYNSSYGFNWRSPGVGSRVPGGHYIATDYQPGGMWLTRAIPQTSELFVGVGYKTGVNGTTQSQMINLQADTATVTHLSISVNAFRKIEVKRGATIIATGTSDLGDEVWHYIEIRATIHDTTGICQVRLDGQSVNEIDFVGDTRNGGTNSTFDAVQVTLYAGSSVAPGTAISDLYILDTNGTANNTWLGDVAVRILTPSAAGTYTQLTNSAGNQTNNYSYVDELPAVTTDYVGSPTVGTVDTYAMTDLAAGISVVRGVQVDAYIGKSDANLASARVRLRSGGSDFNGATQALSTTYREYYEFYENDPATGLPWTVGGVNAAEAGMEVR